MYGQVGFGLNTRLSVRRQLKRVGIVTVDPARPCCAVTPWCAEFRPLCRRLCHATGTWWISNEGEPGRLVSVPLAGFGSMNGNLVEAQWQSGRNKAPESDLVFHFRAEAQQGN